jgi:hypothetical protein
MLSVILISTRMEITLKDFYEFSREQLFSINENLVQLNRRVGNLEVDMLEVKDHIDDMTIALDDALGQLVGHEKRITRLERKGA